MSVRPSRPSESFLLFCALLRLVFLLGFVPVLTDYDCRVRTTEPTVRVVPPQCIMLGSFFFCALLRLVFLLGVVPVLSIIINVLTDYDCRVRTPEPTVRVVPPHVLIHSGGPCGPIGPQGARGADFPIGLHLVIQYDSFISI